MEAIEIRINEGPKEFVKDFKETFDGKTLFDCRIEVRPIHTFNAIEYVVVTLILYVPLKILRRFLNRVTDEAGDKLYESLKKAVKDFHFKNQNNCKFGFLSKISIDEKEYDIKITPKEFSHANLDALFNRSPFDIERFFGEIQPPINEKGEFHIHLYDDKRDVGVFYHSIESGIAFQYVFSDSRWVNVSMKEYKCQYCYRTAYGPDNEFIRFNVCPSCGRLFLETNKYIREYFRIIQLSMALDHCVPLILEAKFDTAVREAIIALERVLKAKSGLNDLYGKRLVSKALEFEFDERRGAITKEPLIKLNDLLTASKRNEQEGVKLMLMGFMEGIRNIYMHQKGAGNLYYTLQIITLVNIYINTILGKDKSIATYSEQAE